MNADFTVVVFAAGRGTRAALPYSKLLAQLDGHPIIRYTLAAVAASLPGKIIVVVGHESERVGNVVASALAGATCPWSLVEQWPLLGTGHAMTLAVSSGVLATAHVVCINGDDSALMTSTAIEGVMSEHRRNDYEASIVLTAVDDSFPFSRVRAFPPDEISFASHSECLEDRCLPLPVATGIYTFRCDWLAANIDCFTADSRGELPIYQLIFRARGVRARWGVINLPPECWASTNTPLEFEQMKNRFRARRLPHG